MMDFSNTILNISRGNNLDVDNDVVSTDSQMNSMNVDNDNDDDDD